MRNMEGDTEGHKRTEPLLPGKSAAKKLGEKACKRGKGRG